MADLDSTTPSPVPTGEEKNSTKTPDAPEAPKPPKRHLIGNAWIRRPLKALGCLVILIVLIPVLLYIPPVQNLLVKTATKIVADKTGMNVEIGKFRLKFPVDVSLQDVSVIEASGDTMVMAREAIADVKLMPLLKLDVQINKLRLLDGYYRMVSPDSSMTMKIRAGLLDVDSKSSADMASSTITLNEATLKNGDVSLLMDVWKQKNEPKDTTATPFLITAKRLNIDGIKFTMMMLPTIDTLRFEAKKLTLEDGKIDLRTNNITFGDVQADGGSALMLAPSLEYVKSHPLPAADSTTPASEPITIRGKRIALNGFDARYAVEDSPKVAGFDANDIRVSALDIEIQNFFNRATDIALPVKSLRGMEQCGLTITEGSGTFSMNADGMRLDSLKVLTPHSNVNVTAAIPNALMTMEPSALLDVDLSASLGMTDINCFMPDLKEYTGKLPATSQLNALLKAEGTLGDAIIPRFDVAVPGFVTLRARGNARNALDMKQMIAKLTFDGELTGPGVVKKFVELQGIDIPRLTISGTANANRENYTADIKLTTPKGNLAAAGQVGMNSERYEAKVNVKNLNVGSFIGDPTIGKVTANLTAHGAGFNPEKHGAKTDVRLDVAEAWYNGHELRDITLLAELQDGVYTIDANSASPLLNFNVAGRGTIGEDSYTADLTADLRNVDLKAFGLSETTNGGSGRIRLSGTAQPRKWLYDLDVTLDKVAWQLPDQDIDIPDALTAHLTSTDSTTYCTVDGKGASVRFNSSTGLKQVIDGFMAAAEIVPAGLKEKRIDVRAMENAMPRFRLTADVDGQGLANEFLNPSGMSIGNLTVELGKDSTLNGNMRLNALNTGSMRLDTITADLATRGDLIDYTLHVGNRPGTLDEFADVNVSGYMGDNRLSAYLVQHNIKRKMGYRLGFTASTTDSIVSLRFTPLKATIAYLPWQFNLDNYVDYTFSNRRVEANLQASSAESSILLKTEPYGDGTDVLHLNLKDIKVQDFLQMAVNAPPVEATVNSDINVRYTGKALIGKGTLGIKDLVYDRMKVGNFDFNLAAGMGQKGKSAGKLGMLVNGNEAAALQFVLAPDSLNPDQGLTAEKIDLHLTRFPLDIANAFFPPQTAKLSGWLNGNMSVSGQLTAPVLNGQISCDSVGVFMNMLGTTFKFDDTPLVVENNVVKFNDYDIYAVNSNPLTIDGTVDARKFSDILFDLKANAKNMQLVGGKSRSADVTGTLFVDLDAKVKGPMAYLDVNANLNVLPTTDVTYNMVMGASEISGKQPTEGVVKFVNFNDTTQVAQADSLVSSLAMRITAKAVISQGTQVTVNLGESGKVECNPSGTLNYFQNFMGDMKLNGTLYTGTGFARYNVPIMGTKQFQFDQSSHITWNGDLMNPTLAVTATDQVKANVSTNGNAQLVNFLVTLKVGNTLSAPSVVFDLSTDNDMAISNELQSMTADQRNQQAMTLLITGMYSGPSSKNIGGNFAASAGYGFLTSQLNSWAANAIKGVDLNFGVDQYETGTNGNTTTNTSYSYQLSKSLINNRFKILVGGNYSTDASADENFEQNLISDVAFEYILKQTNNMSLNAKLFRHTGFESVLEGEITETGVGLSLRRRLAYFTEISHFGLSHLWKKKKGLPADSTGGNRKDSLIKAPAVLDSIHKDSGGENKK